VQEDATEQENKRRTITPIEVISIVWKSKKLIAYIVTGATALAILVCVIMPNYYMSSVTILPEAEQGRMSSLGGISDLASLAGISVGEGSLVKMYPQIIQSEAVLKDVIYAKYYSENSRDSVNIVDFWRIDGTTHEMIYERSLQMLRELLSISMDLKTSIITFSIETKDAAVSAGIVNAIASGLDRFMRTRRTTNATEQRRWIEARLVEVKQDLGNSENVLKEFAEKNRRVADSPELMLERDRLYREVQINTTIYTELKRQYEIIKIEEIKNIPIVTVMDAGRPAALKSRPHRSVIVITVFTISLIIAIGYVVACDYYAMSMSKLWLLGKNKFKAATG